MKKSQQFYLIKTLNADSADTDKGKIIKSLESFQEKKVDVYESILFINGTGYQQTVIDEIEYVLLSNERTQVKDKESFIHQWKLEKYKYYKISELSGGWKKYLSLALFSNIYSENKLFFDSMRQLSDKLIFQFIENLYLTPTAEKYFFFEYDTNIFPKSFQHNSIVWDYKKACFTEDSKKINGSMINNLYESNFPLNEY